jgi:hypothetical protein
MADAGDGRKLARESKSGDMPEKCPKCGSQKISACAGGSNFKAVPGIWWSCQECHHEW